jgi:homoserine kinase
VKARAPASVGNVAVGFDLLGHSIEGPADVVSVERIPEPRVEVRALRGEGAERLPREPEANSAGAALLALRAALDLPFGFSLEIDKGIPLASGLGGSAASAVAALVAANALLPRPLPREALYPFALAGEEAASGSRHGDNVAPQLLGGLTLAGRDRLLSLPCPPGLCCALVHPRFELPTRKAREVLATPYSISEFVAQSECLALFLLGLERGDLALIRAGLKDLLVEPRRASLVPGFAAVKAAALDHGALGASLSGAGPSVFAWFASEQAARAALEAMREAFADAGLASEGWVSPVAGPRAELLPCAA